KLGWRSARLFSELAGAPVAAHMLELLTRGRVADGSRAGELLGVRPQRTTPEVCEELYAWAEIVRVPATGHAGLEAA
ncbi:MAG: hypothetical protein ACXWA3_13895, partial [Acidimicrobiales bacterium]